MADPKPIDEVQALEAKLKRAKGLDLSKSEESLIRRYDQKIAEDCRDEFLLACSKQVYCKLANRNRNVVDEHARTYAIPVDQRSINLYQVLRKFHDLLSEWGPTIRQMEGEEGSLKIEKSRMENELLRKKIIETDLNIKSKQDDYIRREDFVVRLEWLANRLRALSERMGKRFGGDAQVMFNLELSRIEEDLIAQAK